MNLNTYILRFTAKFVTISPLKFTDIGFRRIHFFDYANITA